MEKFLALDVETANPDCSSICQIGIAAFENGKVTETWRSLINPEDYFDGFNVSVHGITPAMVKESPVFKDVYPTIRKIIGDQVVVHHTFFDRTSVKRACELHSCDLINAQWLDSAKVVRRTWSEFSKSGYGLSNMAKHLGISFKHHDALEDAIAAGKVFLSALQCSGLSLHEWLVRVNKPISSSSHVRKPSVKFEPNPEGPFFGEHIVFTGTLGVLRAEAEKLAAEMGCNPLKSVNRNTTMLVLGAQDNFRLAGYEKSRKHRDAEKLISQGYNIRILTEGDFFDTMLP